MKCTDREDRIMRVKAAIAADERCDAIVISNPHNIEYLTGAPGEDAWVFLTPARGYFITDKRYAEAAETFFSASPYMRVVVMQGRKTGIVLCKQLAARHRARTVGFEARHMSFALAQKLCQAIGNKRMIPVHNFIESFRMVKDAGEIARMKESMRRNEQVLKGLMHRIRPGVTERDLAVWSEIEMRKRGADDVAFKTIVASGAHTAIPHAVPRDRAIARNGIVLVDLGMKYRGYCSDLTRTFMLGTMSKFYRRTYDNVLKAQEIAIAAIRPGVRIADVVRQVHGFFKKQRCLEHFTHSLGHGLGMQIHETPSLAVNSELTFKTGMVVTVEPGLYYPGSGGVRVEDVVAVTECGCECISAFPKERESMRL